MPSTPTNQAQHTVAVYLPGTPVRVLVNKLEGTEQEAVQAAHLLVQRFAEVAPVRWAHKVVATDLVTDVANPNTDQEISE